MNDDNEDPVQKPTEKLHEAILGDIRQRSVWETRQTDFYRMRHNGIRRKQKPWINAADLHFPLIDTNIEKLKPLFFQQIVGMDVVATFVPMCSQYAAATTTAEQWFDYKIRERTNLQDEALAWIDYALMAGRGVIKVTWDAQKKRVQYDAIDPLYVVVPSHTKELQDADRVTHVMHYSEASYKRQGVYKADKETLERIKGADTDKNDASASAKADAARLREGITHASKNDKIIIWEVYDRQDDGSWIVRSFSPAAPDIELRDPMALPYEHGMVPFVDFAYETKDKGWYSPRGIAEILAAFESALCHTWNQKHDAMQLFNKPTYRAEREVPNSMNLRVAPGQILPYGIVPNPSQQVPQSFDDEMTNTRSIAEQRVSNPDYGMGQVLDTKNRRTATEISAIGAQSQQAGDLRARCYRMALGKLYKMSWGLFIQYDKDDLRYRFQDDSIQMDPVALHEKYHIEPKGGVNEVNKQFLLQKAISRKQIFQNSPWIDQAELDRSILNLDDPSLIKTVFHDPNLKAQDESTDEAKGIPTMLLGYAIPVKQGDNYSARIGVLMQFIQSSVKAGQSVPPLGQQTIVTRLQGLLAADAQVDNNGAKQLAKSVNEYLQSIGWIPAQQPGGQQQSMAPGNAPGVPPATSLQSTATSSRAPAPMGAAA